MAVGFDGMCGHETSVGMHCGAQQGGLQGGQHAAAATADAAAATGRWRLQVAQKLSRPLQRVGRW